MLDIHNYAWCEKVKKVQEFVFENDLCWLNTKYTHLLTSSYYSL